jgi:hypothetical protein
VVNAVKKSEVIKFYGSEAKAAAALGLTRQTINAWGEEVPTSRLQAVLDNMDLETLRRKKQRK